VIYCAVTFTPGTLDETTQFRVSVDGLRALIGVMKELRAAGWLPACRLVYVSTNAVFSGLSGPYHETGLPDPELRTDAYRAYGLARRAGEQVALAEWPDSLVARTANVDGYDAWGVLNPRLRGLVDALSAGKTLPRFVDRSISPTLVDNVAEALLEIASPGFALPAGRTTIGRVMHLAGCQPMTDYDYALRLARRLGVPETLVVPDHCLPPGSTGRYSIALDVAATQAFLRTRLLDVDGMLERIFEEGSPHRREGREVL
jgi:dTDP-4-dehydrorhamnose reductase